MVPSAAIQIDKPFVSRLLIGALSEHEQRRLVARLLRLDSTFRLSVAAVLEPFEMFDQELAAEYAEALERRQRDPGFDLAAARRAILERARRAAGDLEAQLDRFTLEEVLKLGEVTHRFFSWTMAELLLERARHAPDPRRVRANLYLALMVIDVVDILGATGHSLSFPTVVEDVRSRIRAAYAALGN
ncbi:MAG: hypothetical protein D6696_00395 [Acidobacteria bacterium]|nr:MAG: hypothetical protein D6696_00395 [Acidobacteriota bacterium]